MAQEIEIKFPLRDPAGEVYGLCGIASDISARKRAEEALKDADRRPHDPRFRTP